MVGLVKSRGGNKKLCSLSTKILSLLGMLSAIQLLSIITYEKKLKINSNRRVRAVEDLFYQPLPSTQHHDHDYPCFPPWHSRYNKTPNHNWWFQKALPVTTVYLKTTWFDLHSETFYSFIHSLCSCSKQKSPQWMLQADVVPHFYIGPKNFISDGYKKVLTEFNRTSCGPFFVGSPTEPVDLTIITTTYAENFNDTNDDTDDDTDDYENYLAMANDTSKIFICHESAPAVEGDRAKNVFWLTPQHSRYIVPTFFPPTIVEQSKEHLRKNPNNVPIFLVIGSFDDSEKRNIASLKSVLEAHRGRQFKVRFLGGQSGESKNESLVTFVNDSFPDDLSKIQLMPNFDSFTFTSKVGEVDVILPLVDETNFHTKYQEGRKLTSSVSWALGFGKKMVIYKQLAEVFSIEEDNATYWQYDHSKSFSKAFGDCLNSLGAL